MYLHADSTLDELLASDKARHLLHARYPQILADPNLAHNRHRRLREIAAGRAGGLDADTLAGLLHDLAQPLATFWPEATARPSLDALDAASFNAGPAPLASEAETIELHAGAAAHPSGPSVVTLDGAWELAEEGDPATRLAGAWEGAWDDAIPAQVPGSVHTALVAAGELPDSTVGLNQQLARQESFKTWWMKRSFARPATQAARLVFGGVANRCTIWLNGVELGSHEGMFGGPEYAIEHLLQDQNVLVVRLEAIPFTSVNPTGNNSKSNSSWRRTVVFNNVYGWHYSNLPSLGIWRTVAIHDTPTISLGDPFVAVRDAHAGIVELVVELSGAQAGWSGWLAGTLAPENFNGAPYSFQKQVRADDSRTKLHLRFTVPDPQLWWPVDLGEPNLYRLTLSFIPDEQDERGDLRQFNVGLRTVTMAPLPDGPRPDHYNWTFVVNGRPTFIKGTNWCTLDPLMDFRRERYDRFLSLARQQHVQMVRGWGSGMPETDDFYDLCDRYGLLVMQEWPTAWNSHVDQPYDVMEETVRRNTVRMRNHPSLVMYGGGNESTLPYGAAIDMMGRLSIELDGTRPFHRGQPWGGSRHDYGCYWGRRRLDHNLTMTSAFWGEFGLASLPVYESVLRYLPEAERSQWPPQPSSAFAYHTPIFNTADDLARLTQYARYFIAEEHTLAEFVVGSQLAQAVGLRHTLERARTRWPECTGALYYKINDNFPAASWATVDWYGAPKIGYYVIQDAFAPLHACLLFDTLDVAGAPLQLPVFLLDDADALAHTPWQVLVRAYNHELAEIKRIHFAGEGSLEGPRYLGAFALSYEESQAAPLLFVAEVLVRGDLVDRTFYWTNFEAAGGSLFRLPRTTLTLHTEGARAVVRNIGALPAVAVEVTRPGRLDQFTVEDSFFWLDPGEEKRVVVNSAEGLVVHGWNVGEVRSRE